MKIEPGAWVASFLNDPRADERPPIGLVKEVNEDPFGISETTIDIIRYDQTGGKLGRVSPAEGGPTSFEPCCPIELWEPIEEPNFDFIRDKFFYGRYLRRLRQG